MLQRGDWLIDTYNCRACHMLDENQDGNFEVNHFETKLRALLRDELIAAVRNAGFEKVRWHVPEESGLSTDIFIRALQSQGLPAKGNPYPPLHTLTLFRDGFDLFTRERCGLSGDYPGYKEGDLQPQKRWPGA